MMETIVCHKCRNPTNIELALLEKTGHQLWCWNCRELISYKPKLLGDILEDIMGGPAGSIFKIRKDSLVVTFDVTPLLKLAGGEWERVLGRVLGRVNVPELHHCEVMNHNEELIECRETIQGNFMLCVHAEHLIKEVHIKFCPVCGKEAGK